MVKINEVRITTSFTQVTGITSKEMKQDTPLGEHLTVIFF